MSPKKSSIVQEETSYISSKLFKISNLSLCLIITCAVFLMLHFNLLERIELDTLDLRFKLRGNLKTDPRIVLIDIDEQSIQNIGRWPWSREWHASLITTLVEYKAKIIAFDIFFSEPTPLIDFFLVESTRLAKNVFYALAFEHGTSQRESPIEDKTLEHFTIAESQIIGDKKNIPEFARPVPPLVELYNNAHGAGHVNPIEDRDGVIRKVPSIIFSNGKYYLHFAIELALDYLDLDRNKVKIVLGEHIDLGLTSKGLIQIPIDNEGFLLVNWAGPWGKVFIHYPFWEVVFSYQKQLKGEEPLIASSAFKDKLCLIGLTATGLIDIKPIPIQSAYPIMGLHANIINTILENKFIEKTKPPVNLLAILFLALFIGFTVPMFRPVGGALFTLVVMILYFIIAYLLFKFIGLWINVIYPLTSVTLSFVAITIHTELANAIERARLYNLAVEDGLTKLFVVRHFKEMLSREMAKSIRYNRPLSLIISDIDHFKNVNDTYGHLAGDFILRETANIFKSSCRELDVAGRYGGEEFIILLPETKLDGAVEFAERLRKLIEGLTLEYDNIKFNIRISFGVSEFKGETNPAEFIKRADEALYVAKETGRNKVCFS